MACCLANAQWPGIWTVGILTGDGVQVIPDKIESYDVIRQIGRSDLPVLASVRVVHCIAVEFSSMLSRVFTARRKSTSVSMAVVIVMVNVPIEMFRAVIPGASADKDTACEPLWTVIAVRSAIVRGHFVVTVWANWRRAYLNGNLCRGALGCHHE